MRIAGRPQPNASIVVPRYGRRDVVATTLGYGMNIVGSVGVARNRRTWYPWVRTSGTWYMEISMANVRERSELNGWIAKYVALASNPGMRSLAPMTISVPSENWSKVGFPTSSIEFGDAFGTGIYTSVIQFTSVSDPLAEGSRYLSPTRDREANQFYPAGNQSRDLPPPVEITFNQPWDDPDNASAFGRGDGAATSPRTGPRGGAGRNR